MYRLTAPKDFETSGLDLAGNNIVEIGLLDDSGARFQTVVCPPVFVDGPAVHGISNEELAEGHGSCLLIY